MSAYLYESVLSMTADPPTSCKSCLPSAMQEGVQSSASLSRMVGTKPRLSLAAGEESGLGGWQFRGKRIAAAVMEDLFQQHGLAMPRMFS